MDSKEDDYADESFDASDDHAVGDLGEPAKQVNSETKETLPASSSISAKPDPAYDSKVDDAEESKLAEGDVSVASATRTPDNAAAVSVSGSSTTAALAGGSAGKADTSVSENDAVISGSESTTAAQNSSAPESSPRSASTEVPTALPQAAAALSGPADVGSRDEPLAAVASSSSKTFGSSMTSPVGSFSLQMKATQLYSNYGAPSGSGPFSAGQGSQPYMIAGWVQDTPLSGLLYLSMADVLRRLSLGMPRSTVDRLTAFIQSFIHEVTAVQQGGQQPYTVHTIKKDRAEAVLSRAGLGSSVVPALSPPQQGMTLIEFLAHYGDAVEDQARPVDVRSCCSLMRLYSTPSVSLDCLLCVHGLLEAALASWSSSFAWAGQPVDDDIQARVVRIAHGTDLLQACGLDTQPGTDGQQHVVLASVPTSLDASTSVLVNEQERVKLERHRAELEVEVESMEASPMVQRVFRELQASPVHIDKMGRSEWLGKLSLSGRLLLRYCANIVTQPHEARNWRINPQNKVFHDTIGVFGEAVSAQLMGLLAFSRQGDYWVLRGMSEHDPAKAVSPAFPGEALLETGRADVAFPAVPAHLLSFLLRRRACLERVLQELDTALLGLGTRLPQDPLMAALPTAGPPPPVQAPVTPGPAAPAPSPGAGSPSRRPAKSTTPAPTLPIDQVLKIRDPDLPKERLVIPILVRANLLMEQEVPQLLAGNVGAAGAGKGSGSARSAPAGRGAAAGKGAPAAGPSGPAVDASDPRFTSHLTQLRLLRATFARLDRGGRGGVTLADVRAVFAAEARPAEQRTEEALEKWLASRDINGDGEVSWPEFAASFAPLFLPATARMTDDTPLPATTSALKPGMKPSAPPAVAAKHDVMAGIDVSTPQSAAAALLRARSALQAEVQIVLNTCLAQVRSVLQSGMPSGESIDAPPAALLGLPWARCCIDVLAGLGQLLLFNDRYYVQTLLAGWTRHLASLKADPTNSTLWRFRVTQEADPRPAADLTLAWNVAQLPGMQLILRGCGYVPVSHSPHAGGTPEEYRLAGCETWTTIPQEQVQLLSASAQVLARHAVVFEAEETSDPAAVLLGVFSAVAGGDCTLSLVKYLASPAAAMASVPVASSAGGKGRAASAKPSSPRKGGAKGATTPAIGPVGDASLDDLLDAFCADKWLAALEVLTKFTSSIVQAPADMGVRRVNPNNPTYQGKLANIPCPRALSGYMPVGLQGVEQEGDKMAHRWSGTRAMTAAGFRETKDGSLFMPTTSPLPFLEGRVVELDNCLPLLRCTHMLKMVKKATDTALRSVAPLPVSAPGSATLPPGRELVPPPALPTTLLSSVLDPRNALQRRFSEPAVLKGHERMPELGNKEGAGDMSFTGSIVGFGGTDALVSTFRQSMVHPLHASSEGFNGGASSVRFDMTAHTAPAPTPARASVSAPSTPARSGSVRGRAPAASGKAKAGAPAAAVVDVPKDQANALIGLGPGQAGQAIAQLLEASEKEKADAQSKLTSLESQLQELKAQVKGYQVAELLPQVKESLAGLDKGSLARQSAVAAAAGLGMRVPDMDPAKSTKSKSKSPTKRPKSPDNGGAKASDKAKLTKNPAVIASYVRLAAPVIAGTDTVFVKCYPPDLDLEKVPQEWVSRLEAGEPCVPPLAQIQPGEWIMFGSDVKASMGFARTVTPGPELDRPGDEYQIVLDRPLERDHGELDFVTRQPPPPGFADKFFIIELVNWLRSKYLPSLIESAADSGEESLRLRAAESVYQHRSVSRRVPMGVRVYQDVGEALIKLPPGQHQHSTNLPYRASNGMLWTLGPHVGVLHSGAVTPLSSQGKVGGVLTHSRVGHLGSVGPQSLWGHVWGLVDYAAQGVLDMSVLETRLQREGHAWLSVSSDAVLPMHSLDPTSLDLAQPTAGQVWQKACADIGPDAQVSEHTFMCLFRPLHPLDILCSSQAELLTTLHWSSMRGTLSEEDAATWGAQWDTAKSAAPLLSEEHLRACAQPFIQVHISEHLYWRGALSAGQGITPLQLDPRVATPGDRITIQGCMAVCQALDGDSPSHAELMAYVAALHKEAVAQRERDIKAKRGEKEEDAIGLSGQDDDEEEDPDFPRLPETPFPCLAFDDVMHFRASRDAKLLQQAPLLLQHSLPAALQTTQREIDPVDSLMRFQRVDALAMERRRAWPTPGLPRLSHVASLVREAYKQVRAVLVRNITQAGEYLGIDRDTVEERVPSVACSDLIASLARTDEGRRVLLFPLTFPSEEAGPEAGHGTPWVTVQSVMEYCARASSTGHVTWSQLQTGITSCGKLLPPILPASEQGPTPLLPVQLPALQAGALAQGSLVAVPQASDVHVVDILPDPSANALCILTSEGSLCSYEGGTFTRSWSSRPLTEGSARAIAWMRDTFMPHTRPLCAPNRLIPVSATGAMDTTSLHSLSEDAATHVVMVNHTLAALAIMLADLTQPVLAHTFKDAKDPKGAKVRTITWHSNIGSGGHVLARVHPRVAADTDLPYQAEDGEQYVSHIPAGTGLLLLECIYLADSHLVFATAIPDTAADVQACVDAASSPSLAPQAWPRVMAVDALTGAAIADLGPCATAMSTGAHLVYNAAARHVLSADLDADGTPLVKVWDVSPVLAWAARQRAQFLTAAVSAVDSVAAAGALHADSESGELTEEMRNLIPQIIPVPPSAVLDVQHQFTATSGAGSTHVVGMCLLESSGMLAVAQANGQVSLWDSRYLRHRLRYPCTAPISQDDYGAFRVVDDEGDDLPLSPAPQGMHLISRTKLAHFYAPAGVLVEATGSVSPAEAGPQAVAAPSSDGCDVHVAMTCAAAGPSYLLSMARLPCRVRFNTDQGVFAAELARHCGQAWMSSLSKSSATDDIGGGGPAATVYAGYVYVMEDGAVHVVNSPAAALPGTRASSSIAAGRLFDPRLVNLSDDTYLLAAASVDCPSDSTEALRKVLLCRHQVSRVFYVISKGVPLEGLLPTLKRMVSVGESGKVGGSSSAGMTIPVCATALHTLLQQLAQQHDGLTGATGAATTSASMLEELGSQFNSADLGAPPSTRRGILSLPLLLLPFYSPGDGPASLMHVRRTDGIVPEPCNPLDAVYQGRCWTTGIVLSIDEGRVTLALDHEERVVVVGEAEVRVCSRGEGTDIASSEQVVAAGSVKKGDRVQVCARTAGTDAVLGDAPVLTLATHSAYAFPHPSAALDQAEPAMDILLLQVDKCYSPQTVSSASRQGDAETPVQASLVRRHLSMWAIGRAHATVPVQDYAQPLPAPSLQAMQQAFARHVHGSLLRASGYWTAAHMVSARRAALRHAMIISKAHDLYMAANTGQGTKVTALALYRGLATVAAHQTDACLPFVRASIRTVLALHTVLEQASSALAPGGTVDPMKVRLGTWLPMLLAAAWHYPMLRHGLRHLFSLHDQRGQEDLPGRAPLPPGVFGLACAVLCDYKKELVQEGETAQGRESSSLVHIRSVLSGVRHCVDRTYTLDTLLSLLEYLRETTSGGGGAQAEHMVQSLVRRHALPWDPPEILALGLADASTVESLSEGGVVSTPLEAYGPQELTFLLANAPSVGVVTDPLLQALARSFADPAAAIRLTLAVVGRVLDRQHERAALPEATLVDPHDGQPMLLTPTELDAMLQDVRDFQGANEALQKIVTMLPDGSPLTLLSAHAKVVSLACALLEPGVCPTNALSIRGALKNIQREEEARKKKSSMKVDESAARTESRISELSDRIYVLLADAPVATSEAGGCDGQWDEEFKGACQTYAQMVQAAANEQPGAHALDAAAAAVSAESRGIATLLSLLAHGSLEALIHAAIVRVSGALRLPGVPRETAVAPAASLFTALGHILMYFEADRNDAARRLAPHLPRLLRAAVYLSLGRLDCMADDVQPDTSKPPPVVHPIDSRMISPSYVSALLPHSLPLWQRWLGVDGKGSPLYPAIQRYILACSSPACLARGPAVIDTSRDTAASPLIPLASHALLAPYDTYFSALHRTAGADDTACKTASGSGGRRVIAWSFEESVENFAKRHKAAAPIVGDIRADLCAMLEEHASHSAAAREGGRALHERTERQEDAAIATILKLASSGNSHMLSPFSAFRRGASYWLQFPSMLQALDKLHSGMPDPVADVTRTDGPGGGQAVANHARLMDRLAARRLAASRFKLVLRPPLTYSRGVAGLEGDVDTTTLAQEQGDGAEGDVADIDRSMLAVDFQAHDLTVALLHDSDSEVRTVAFKAIRALSLALAWPCMEGGGATLLDLNVDTRALSSYAARAKARRWTDIMQRFCSLDSVVGVVRRMSAYVAWSTAGQTGTAHPAPESHEAIALGVDVLHAQAALRMAQPGVWRSAGVLGVLSRLSQACLPKPGSGKAGSTLPSTGGGGPAGKGKAGTKDYKAMLRSKRAALEGVLPDVTTADAVLRRVCTDVGWAAMHSLVRYDHSARTWAKEHGVPIQEDTTGKWEHVLAYSSQILDSWAGSCASSFARVLSLSPGERLGGLDEATSNTADALMQSFGAHLPGIKRALMMQVEAVVTAKCPHPLEVQSVIRSCWSMFSHAWSMCAVTYSDEEHRKAAQSVAQAWLSIVADATKRGMMHACMMLACPLQGDISQDSWPGLPALVHTMSAQVHLQLYDPDAARLVQSRAAFVVGDLLAKAIDTALMPSSTHAADAVGMRRAGLERRFAVLALGQMAECDIVAAYLANVRHWTTLVKETAAVKALEQHAMHCAGQTFALSIHARALVWTGLWRAATLTMPTVSKQEVAGRVAAGEKAHEDGGGVSGVLPSDLLKIAKAFTEALVHYHAPRALLSLCLANLTLLPSHSHLPHALRGFGNTYLVRMEAVAAMYSASILLSVLRAKVSVSRAALATGAGLGKGAGTEASQVALGTTLLNVTMKAAQNSTAQDGDEGLDLTTTHTAFLSSLPLSARAVSEEEVVRAYSALVQLVEEDVGQAVAADGIVSAERTRLWKCKDMALTPSICLLLQSLLQTCPRDEALTRSLQELGVPEEAWAWGKAGRNMLAVHASTDVTLSDAQARQAYMAAERSAVSAWQTWRLRRFQLAPMPGEVESTRPAAKNAPLPPTVTAIHDVTRMLNLSTRFSGAGTGVGVGAGSGGGGAGTGASSMAQSSILKGSSVLPPTVPGTPGMAHSTAATGTPVVARARSGMPPSAVPKPGSEGTPLAHVQAGRARPTGLPAAQVLANTSKRLQGSQTGTARLSRRASLSAPPPAMTRARVDAVLSTAAALAALGEGVVEVKAAFDKRAKGGAGEASVPSDEAEVGRVCQAVGLPYSSSIHAQLLAQGLLPDTQEPLPFSSLLRVVAQVMALAGLSALPAARAALVRPGTAAATAAVTTSQVAPAPTQPSGARAPPASPFRADIASKLPLPSVPIPQELLRSVFERFSTARSILVHEGGSGSAAVSRVQHASVQGIAFVSWPTAFSAAGQPVVPAEARELYRFVGLALAELCSYDLFVRAYSALVGYRWLAMAGLLGSGSDMLAVAADSEESLLERSRASRVGGVGAEEEASSANVSMDQAHGAGLTLQALVATPQGQEKTPKRVRIQVEGEGGDDNDDGAASPLST